MHHDRNDLGSLILIQITPKALDSISYHMQSAISVLPS